VTLRAGGHDDPTVRIEELRQPLDGPLGPEVAAWFERQDWLRDNELLDKNLRTADDLQLRQEAGMGPDGWEVGRQILALTGGLRWAEEVDPVALALVGGCNGSVSLRAQVELLAAAHDLPAEVLAEVAVPLAAHLIERGILLPA
jgi:hypothetical protein